MKFSAYVRHNTRKKTARLFLCLTRLLHGLPSMCDGVSVSNVTVKWRNWFSWVSGYVGHDTRNKLGRFGDVALNPFNAGFIFCIHALLRNNEQEDGYSWNFQDTETRSKWLDCFLPDSTVSHSTNNVRWRFALSEWFSFQMFRCSLQWFYEMVSNKAFLYDTVIHIEEIVVEILIYPLIVHGMVQMFRFSLTALGSSSFPYPLPLSPPSVDPLPGPLFTKWTDILLQDIMKYRSCECCWDAWNIQSDTIIITFNLTPSRVHEYWCKYVLPLSE